MGSQADIGKPARFVIGAVAMVFYLLIAWMVVWLVWYLFINGRSHSDFKASVVSYSDTVDPEQLEVTVTIKNTSSQQSYVDCTITASGDSDKYSGLGYAISPDRIAPGATATVTSHVYLPHGDTWTVTDVHVGDCYVPVGKT